MKKFMTFLRNIRFTQQTPTQFLLFVSLYALALAMWVYYFPAIVAAILVLFFVVICALRWRVMGGVLSSVWGTALMTVSYFTHQHSTLRDLIVGSSAYFVVGVGLGTVINLMESQRLRLEESESRYRHLFEQASEAILLFDSDGMIRDCNPAAGAMLGYSHEELLTKNIQDLVIPQPEQMSQIQEGKPLSGEWTFQNKNGNTLITEASISKLDSGLFLGIGHDITPRKQMEETLRRERDRAQTYLDLVQVMIVALDSQGRVTLINRKGCEILGCDPQEIIGKNWFDNFLPESVADEVKSVFERLMTGERETAEYYENAVINRAEEERLIAWHNLALRDSSGAIIGTLSAGEDITERKKAEIQIEEQIYTLSVLYDLAQKSSEILDLRASAHEVVRCCVENFGAFLAWLAQTEPDGRVKNLAQYPEEHPYPRTITVRWDDTPQGQGPTGRAIRSGTYQITEDIATDSRFMPWGEAARQAGFFASAAFPLISRGHTFGALNLYSQTSGFFHSKRLELFQTIAHHAASVLENARLFEEAQRRLKHIEALRTIDMAITGSLEPQHALNVALEQIVCQLEVDAVSLLRLNPSTQTLEYAAGRGFHTRTIEQTSLRLGEGLAGRAALEQRTVYVPNLSERSGFTRTGLFAEEGFVTYYAVPLIARGRVLGVLEIFHRSLHVGSDEWHEFLRNLVEQTVIAIDNAELFHNLERSNIELVQAYDVTIEGWAYALDLKDKETEGHSRRVMELTLRIAREMGVKEEELVHIRRGALLHDIGKMGIHDAILLKPRKLTDEEWEIMQKHPVYAYQMLSRIEYLHPALDIPYCHHEKWDGSGYPQGLKGEEIPLPARIFAVVDTYDALTNHRPYRKAWPKEKALEYLHEQSGKHFDPRVVEVFLALDDFDSFNKKKQEEPK